MKISRQVKKKLEHYISLNYPVETTKIPVDEGGGYSVCIPSLGRKAFIADGDTVEEALKNLEALKEESFVRMLEKNIQIPQQYER